MAKKKPKANPEAPTFELAMTELEAIVGRLEQGGGSLEDALQDYSQAIGLMKVCHQKLADVERRVEMLSGVDAEGNPITQPHVDEGSDVDLNQKRAARGARRSAESAPHNLF